jgi:hypothetical protein
MKIIALWDFRIIYIRVITEQSFICGISDRNPLNRVIDETK